MGDGKSLPEGQRHFGHQKFDWNCGGIGGDDTVFADHRIQTFVQIALDIETFDHGFNNPIAFRELVKISLDGARLNQINIAALVQRRGFRFLQPLQSVIGRFGCEIQQKNFMACICDLSGDARAHGASADNCDAFECHALCAC